MLCLLSTGCFGRLAHKLADREVYNIIKTKEQQTLGHATKFNVAETTTPLTRDVLDKTTQSLADATHTLPLTLADALELALDNNRDYQTQKENVYVAALDLTDARHTFAPLFSGNLERTWERRPAAGTAVERFGQTTTNFGVTQLLATGARITVGFTNQILRTYTGPKGTPLAPIHYPIDATRNQLSASIVQPLLRGFGPGPTLEALRQSERDVIYEIRDFARFRQAFIIERTNQFLRVLEVRNRIDNERMSLDRSTVRRERAEAMEAEQRMPRYEVDQARQDEYRARLRWINAQTEFKQNLDQFKLALGLPLELQIEPDPSELIRLEEQGPIEVPYEVTAAQEYALAARRDYQNALARVEDAERKRKVAENNLLPAADISGNWQITDEGDNRRRYDLDARTRRYGWGANLEFPLDRKRERNAYRSAEIELARARRNSEEVRNRVLAQVRDAMFSLSDARSSYEIQVAAEALAQRRVENVRMLFEIGREGISIRDQLEAESALRDTQNSKIQALIDYTIARLRFFDTIEQLEIDEQGTPHESTTAQLE